MKVILLKDVPKVGQKYDVKEVSGGFARNFLLPQNVAMVATPKALESIEQKKKVEETEKKIHKNLLVKNIEDLNGVKITVKERANEQGHLFAGIHKEEIAKEIKSQTHLDIDPQFIEIESHIKETGEHEIKVSAENQKAVFTLAVEAK